MVLFLLFLLSSISYWGFLGGRFCDLKPLFQEWYHLGTTEFFLLQDIFFLLLCYLKYYFFPYILTGLSLHTKNVLLVTFLSCTWVIIKGYMYFVNILFSWRVLGG